ncbi:MAG: tryptophan-rich sensory protein [Leptolyngbyaceae cyanobacterium SL_1_1]|nr:tryptophan-rich sensory protein [Leptolyngbyaceae cyanobacterium RM1_1_2]NJO09360.1 tryptophan-rich sensory protein [Leptolyngbyaceae cyanobacterium SL_1_1]
MTSTPQRPSKSGLRLAVTTLASILATLVVNTLSNLYPPQGKNIGEISNTVLGGVLITPASYAFAIWGVIYVGLIAYGLYQLRPTQRQAPTIGQVNVRLIVACVAQIIWVYLFTLQFFGLSVLAMLAILFALIGAYLQLNTPPQASRKRRWFAQVPLSIYLAWISVATIVNVASVLYSFNWSGWGLSGVGWTVLMLVVGGLLAAIVALQRGDIAFALVYVWAYGAIALRHLETPTLWLTAGGLAIALLIVLAVGPLRRQMSARS